jgi:hypothetical protein
MGLALQAHGFLFVLRPCAAKLLSVHTVASLG